MTVVELAGAWLGGLTLGVTALAVAGVVRRAVYARRRRRHNTAVRCAARDGFARGQADYAAGQFRVVLDEPPVEFDPRWPHWCRQLATRENCVRVYRAAWIRGYADATFEQYEGLLAKHVEREAGDVVAHFEELLRKEAG